MAHIEDTLRSESLVFGVERLGKECSACGKVKPVEEFARQRGGKYGRRSQRKKCLAPSKAAYRKENREKARVSESRYRAKRRMQLQALAPVSQAATISMRKLNLRKKHNLSVEEYEEMY